MVFSDPNNTNSIAYQHTLLSYWLKTSHWNISWAATLHLYNLADRGEKLQQPHCYHLFSDSRDTYLTKDHYENYSPKMVPTNPTGSWTIIHCIQYKDWTMGPDSIGECYSLVSRGPRCHRGDEAPVRSSCLRNWNLRVAGTPSLCWLSPMVHTCKY